MGLDVIAYKKLKEVGNSKLNSHDNLVEHKNEWCPGICMEWSETHFPGRGEGIESNKVYTYESKCSFRAGSYSGYNEWRDLLYKFKGDIAFQELIIFADNEGVIGPVVSKKLYEDFKKYKNEAEEYAQTAGDWWLYKYNDWLNAFELASDNGAVEFC